MKALRYLLIAVTVLSVLSLSAQTHQYVSTHNHEQATYTVQVNPQMPAATMDYRHSDYMTSGSTLPQAALEGTYTTYDQGNSSGGHKGHIRTAGPGQTGGGGPDDREDPYGDPIGDAAIPLVLLACTYVLARAFRKNRA